MLSVHQMRNVRARKGASNARARTHAHTHARTWLGDFGGDVRVGGDEVEVLFGTPSLQPALRDVGEVHHQVPHHRCLVFRAVESYKHSTQWH